MKLLVRWAINAVAIWIAFEIVPGITPVGSGSPAITIIVVAFIFGLLNATIRPILKFLTCPLLILTLGLGTLLINALMFWLTGAIGAALNFGFLVDGFWAAFLGALVVSIVSIMLNICVGGEGRKRKRKRKKDD